MTLHQNLFSFAVGTTGFQLMHVNISIFLQEFNFANGKVVLNCGLWILQIYTLNCGYYRFPFNSFLNMTFFRLSTYCTRKQNPFHSVFITESSKHNYVHFHVEYPKININLNELNWNFHAEKKKVLKFWKNTSKMLGMEPEGIFKFRNLSENSKGSYIFLLRSFSPIKCCSFFSAHPFLISLRFKNCISLPKQKCHLPL